MVVQNKIRQQSCSESNQKAIFGARASFWISLGLVLITLSVYGQVRHFDFINYDDPAYVTNNPFVINGINKSSLRWVLLGEVGSNWHPITMLSHMMDVTLYGMNAGAHHLTNVQFHIANTILMFLVFFRLGCGLWPSAFISVVFALHPLHVESVAWISERKDVLSTFFWLLTMLSYISYVRHHDRIRYWSTLLLFTLGLLAKPMLVTLPFVLLLIDFWPLNRMGKAHEEKWFVWVEKLPFFLITACFSIITYFIQNITGAVSKIGPLPWFVRLANAVVSYLIYLIQTFWPASLSVFYPYPKVFNLFQYLGSSIFLVSISLFFWINRRRFPYGFVGWFWFLGTLVPVIGLVQVGLQGHADRYMYIPMTGLAIIIACGGRELVRAFALSKQLVFTLCIATVAIMGIISHHQVSKWKESLSLFSQAAQNTKDNATAFFCIAAYYQTNSRFSEAEQYYLKALKLTPDDAQIHLNLVAIYKSMRKEDLVEKHFDRLVKCQAGQKGIQKQIAKLYMEKKEWHKAKELLLSNIAKHPLDADSMAYLGIISSELGNSLESLALLKRSAELDPSNAMIQNNLAVCYQKLSRIPDAIAHFGKALELEPGNTQYLESFRGVLQEQQELRKKASALEALLVIHPEDAEGLFELAMIHSLLQQPEKELQNLQAAVRAKPNFQKALVQLGIAYAKRGRYSEALQTFQELAISEPGNPEWMYKIATVQARMGDATAACASLRTAVNKGFSDYDKIRTDLNFNAIAGEECFRSILENEVSKVMPSW
jgi:tetratricopeptide (TPR) repeat protein